MMIRAFLFLIAVFFIFLVFGFFGNSGERQTGEQDVMKQVVTVRDAVFNVNIANTPEEQQNGLMGVTNLSDNNGMLFIFDRPRVAAFWNKNVLIPLDVLWIRSGRVTGIYSMRPEAESGVRVIESPGAVDLVLEIAGGAAERMNISVGDEIQFNDD